MKDDESGWARSADVPIILPFHLLFFCSFLLLFLCIEVFSARRISCQHFIGCEDEQVM
jgi:hypothetical protein